MMRNLLAGIVVLALSAPWASAQTVDELLAKNAQSKGGVEKIKAVKTMKMTGKMIMGGGMEAPFVMMTQRPKSMRMEFTFQGLTGIQAYDGANGWFVMPFMGKKDPEQMTADDNKEMDEQADFDGPLMDYKTKGHKIELLGKEQVEGTDAYKLKVTLKNGDVRYYYLEAETGLEIKSEGKRKVRGTEIEFESSIGDYKEVGGLMIAHSMEQGAKGSPQKQKMVLEKIELNAALPDTAFRMPAGTKPPAPDTTRAAAAKPDTSKAAKSTAAKSTAAKPDTSKTKK